MATVRKEFNFLKPRYTIDGPSWQVGDFFLEHDYQLVENGKAVVDTSKEWLTWGDAYALDIANETNTVLALGVIIVIDCVIASQRVVASS